MMLVGPGGGDDWHNPRVSWREIKAAALLALTFGLAAYLLF